MKIPNTIVITILLVLASCQVWAQRTTPITISTSANTVKIDPSNNFVTNQGKWVKLQPLTSLVYLTSGTSGLSPVINTSGYSSMRAVFCSSSASASMKVSIYFKSSGTNYYWLAGGDFASGLASSAIGGNMTTPTQGTCVFVMPVLSDQMYFKFENGTGVSQAVYTDSWVYLTN